MAKGDGGISRIKTRDGKVDRDRWRVTVCFGSDPSTGKRIRKTRLVTGTKADARAVRDAMKAQYEKVQDIKDPEKTFGAFADEWQEARVVAKDVSNSTLIHGSATIKSLKKYLGEVKLEDITPRMIDSTMTRIRKEKEATLGRPCSGTTMVRIFATLKQILQQAVNYDLIVRNPCDRATRPKLSKPNRRALSEEEASHLLNYLNECTQAAYEEHVAKEERQKEWGVDENRVSLRGISKMSYLLAVRIGLATGMRRGEVFGLTWSDFDGTNGTLNVNKSLTQYHDNGTGIKEPKTDSAYRTIHIDQITTEYIVQFKELQIELLHKLRMLDANSYELPEDQPLLCSNVAGMCDLRNFQHWWKTWIKGAGIPDLRFHELRHTQATLLLANNVDVKTVQTRMGHSNAALTLNWYAHPNPENDAKAANLLGSLFATEQAV